MNKINSEENLLDSTVSKINLLLVEDTVDSSRTVSEGCNCNECQMKDNNNYYLNEPNNSLVNLVIVDNSKSDNEVVELVEMPRKEAKRRLFWLMKRAMKNPIDLEDMLPGDMTTKYALKYLDNSPLDRRQ